ncbi:MAG: hypothetical protein IH623_31810, partial [Verrucomicrobia bacterium]|nr:hypothetical protein [Verrucomicrobiota bacterium]
PEWQQGVQYARFANVAVTEAGQAVTITVRPGVYGYAIISGLQIAQSGGTGAEMPTVSNRKTISMFREPGLTTRLRFAGIAGRSYVVQASTNLKNWEAVATVVADTSGVCAFEDQDAIRFSSRYYRIVVP